MGYTTQFNGQINLSRALTLDEAEVLLEFNDDPDSISDLEDFKQPRPDGYLQWVPTQALDGIVWDGEEKFSYYAEWMQWLVNWLQHRGITASGKMRWSGDEVTDTGTLCVIDGVVTAIADEVSGLKTPRSLSFKMLRTMRAAVRP